MSRVKYVSMEFYIHRFYNWTVANFVCVCVQNYCFSYCRECDATLEISIYFLIITRIIAEPC